MAVSRQSKKTPQSSNSSNSSVPGAPDRVSFAKLREPLEVPGLLDVQTDSFEWLVGAPRWREIAAARGDAKPTGGLEEVLYELSPIEDFSGSMSLSFSDPRFDEVKAPVDECKDKDMTYAAPLFVTAEFINNNTGEIKSQTVFMGDFPMMTEKGTFIINGTERVVVSQLVRSPGVYFDDTIDKSTEKVLHSVKVIPSRGAWLEFDIDKRDTVGVRIDRKRRQAVTVLLKALGWSNEQIRERFGFSEIMMQTLERDPTSGPDEALLEIYRRLRPGEPPTKESAQTLLENLFFKEKRYDLARVGRYKINKKLGLSATPAETSSTTLTEEDVVATVEYLVRLHEGQTSMTVPGGVEVPVETDDIDHFGNRRLRTVGELIQNQIRVGMSRMERVVRERMTTQDVEAITPQTLINIRPVVAAIKEFFGTSQLSQFMDQNNPLSGLTHKRRLSALGPGGLSRERAGLEVRDVHPSHYGRMCPIETPEGPNIGLIGSLSVYARVNPFGFIETPYRKVNDGVVSDEIQYLTADEEDRHVVAQANSPIDENGRFTRGPRAGSTQGRRGRVRLLGRGRLHGRLAAPDGLGGHRDDSVPRARRRQPRPDGCQHAAPGGSAGAQRGTAGGYRHGVACRDRRRRRRRRREGGRDRGGVGRLHHRDGRRRHPAHLPDAQVRPVQPRHLRQPASDRGRR